MNSAPPSSSAALMRNRARAFTLGTPAALSARVIVLALVFDLSANSRVVQRSAARACLI
jgi:hypothetical protein